MRTLLKLIHFEIHRFRLFLFALMALTALVQIGAIVFHAIEARVARMPGPGKDPTALPGPVSVLDVLIEHPQLYAFPVLVCIAVLLLYMFLIWYREWIGRGTFIYRLLALPNPRGHLYASKLAALLLFIFVLLAWQLLLLAIMHGLFNAIVPGEFRYAILFGDMIAIHLVFQLLLPPAFESFMLYYGMGIVSVLVVFTTIVLERGRRPRGLVAAIAYAVGMGVLLLGSVVARVASLHEWLGLYGYEMTWIVAGVWVLAGAFSVWLGVRALNRTISV